MMFMTLTVVNVWCAVLIVGLFFYVANDAVDAHLCLSLFILNKCSAKIRLGQIIIGLDLQLLHTSQVFTGISYETLYFVYYIHTMY